jgi:DNA-binding NarL/FixJ family response regulator
VVADDHTLVREGLKKLLRVEPAFEIVGEAGTGVQAIQIVRESQPHILLLDLGFPDLNGSEVLKKIQDQFETRTIILSMCDDQAHVIDALRNGAIGYVIKDDGCSQLVDAIRTVVGGNQIFLSESAPRLSPPA